MILKISGRSNAIRIINLNKTFFSTETRKRDGRLVEITPQMKARDLGLDLMGRDYAGHILEENGEIIQDTFKEVPSFDQSLSAKIAKKFK